MIRVKLLQQPEDHGANDASWYFSPLLNQSELVVEDSGKNFWYMIGFVFDEKVVKVRKRRYRIKKSHCLIVDGFNVKNMDEILEVVAAQMFCEPYQIKSPSRLHKITAARHLFCHVCAWFYGYTLIEIGNYLKRHHSSITFSVSQADNWLEVDANIQKSHQSILSILKSKNNENSATEGISGHHDSTSEDIRPIANSQ